ncbi:MAG: hypothetical protein R2827_00890 [Bdellovibrionales bacterium]
MYRSSIFKRSVWVIICLIAGAYFGSALVAEEFGEEDEEVVEHVVGHDTLHEHEEAGEKIPKVALALFLVRPYYVFRPSTPHVNSALLVLSLIGLYPDRGRQNGRGKARLYSRSS